MDSKWLKVGRKNARKIQMNALKLSLRNKPWEHRYVLIEFWSKKCLVEKAWVDQNATTKGVEKIKWACQVKLCEP